MKNDTYSIIKLNKELSSKLEADYLVVISDGLSCFDCECLECDFRKLNYHGKVLFDYMLIYGVSEVCRIDIDYFDGTEFVDNSDSIKLSREYVDVCKTTCAYLKDHPELMVGSALSEQEKEMIIKGYAII